MDRMWSEIKSWSSIIRPLLLRCSFPQKALGKLVSTLETGHLNGSSQRKHKVKLHKTVSGMHGFFAFCYRAFKKQLSEITA